jgi:cis-3-alkyl-4-acyloxetan-2-one decarboxylase
MPMPCCRRFNSLFDVRVFDLKVPDLSPSDLKAPEVSATTNKLSVNGIEVFLEGQGEQTILMIHGWPDTYRLWDGQVALLKEHFRCARFSLPGFEVNQPARASSFDEMMLLFKAITDAVSPGKPVILMLHDWGCVFGYQFAAQYPQRVARMVGVDIGDSFSKAFLGALTGKEKLMIAAYQLWLALAYKLGGLGTTMTRWMARTLRCKVDPTLIAAQQNYPYVMQWTGGFKKAVNFFPHCPFLYLYGKRKPFMFHSPKWLEKLAAHPGSEVHGFATGHWVMAGDPVGFNQKLLAWLLR